MFVGFSTQLMLQRLLSGTCFANSDSQKTPSRALDCEHGWVLPGNVMTCRVAGSSARCDGDSLVMPTASCGTGVVSSRLQDQMGEAFPKKQPWPHLDRVIAEAGKQINSAAFST